MSNNLLKLFKCKENAKATLREKCPYSQLFWSVFSGIRTEYGPELL